jgi:hypothetical protein
MGIKKVEYVFDPFKLTGMKKPRGASRPEILEEIADFTLESVLVDVGSQKSPVTGRKFRKLKKSYAAKKRAEGAPAIPNLELTGNMLDTLKTDVRDRTIAIGIYDANEVGKADNHNKFSAASMKTKVPPRRFIPRKGEKFHSEIIEGMKRIIISHED